MQTRKACPATTLRHVSDAAARIWGWRWQLDIVPPGAKRKRISRPLATEDEATGSLREHLDRFGRHGFTQGSAWMTILEWMASWIEPQERRAKAGTLKDRSWESSVSHVRRYVEGSELDAIRLDRITRDAMESFHDGLSDQGPTASTVHRIHATIRRSLADAAERSVPAANPATGVHEAPTGGGAKTRPWNQTEPETFFASEVVKNDYDCPALHLAATAGMRRGELLALR